jgi:hypothetical protein
MNLEKLDEIYKALKTEDDKALEWGQRQSALPSSILAETLIRCGSKETPLPYCDTFLHDWRGQNELRTAN